MSNNSLTALSTNLTTIMTSAVTTTINFTTITTLLSTNATNFGTTTREVNSTKPSCPLVYGKIERPWTHLSSSIFMIFSFIAIVGNSLAMWILLKPDMRKTKSNKILISLVASDLLVGYILLPFSAYQIFDESHLKDCLLEELRVIFSVSTIGTSSMNVGLIAYDRYSLITKLSNYNQDSGHSKVYASIFMVWIIPFLCFIIRFLSLKIYMLSLSLMIYGPLAALIVFYILLLLAVHTNEKNIRVYNRSRTSTVRLFDGSEKSEEAKAYKRRRRVTKIVSSASILVCCYILCLIPTAIGLSMSLACSCVTQPQSIQYFFLFSRIAAGSNSCINPIIYASRYPKIRNYFIKIFRVKAKELMSDSQTLDGRSAEFK